MAEFDDVCAVILAGGSGTRLWPLSRLQTPKQFLRLAGAETLLEATIARLSPLVESGQVTIVTSEESSTGEGYEILHNFACILEPAGRNTGPAVAIAALEKTLEGRDPIMIVLPADHLITDLAALHEDLRSAIAGAREGKLVLFGIRPTRAETGYGYINAGAGAGFRKALGFHEKPDSATADRFMSEGHYFWNSGMFVWRASAILHEVHRHHAGISAVLARIESEVHEGKPFEVAVNEYFADAPSISIDKAVLEHSDKVWILPGHFGWSDVGSWDSVHESAHKDDHGNALQGAVIAIDCEGTLVRSESRLVSVLGMKDVVVVDTPDALLVIDRKQSQRVREIVTQLSATQSRQTLTHVTVKRPWGSYTVLEETPGAKIKRITVRPGGRLSLQSHKYRSEHWVVVSGVARVTIDGLQADLSRNQSTFVPVGSKHRLENRGTDPLHLIEVQVGDYVEEDDISRYDDDYGR